MSVENNLSNTSSNDQTVKPGNETHVTVNGKKYSYAQLDKLYKAATTYAAQHLSGKEAEAYKEYAASIVNDIKAGNPVFLENGQVRKKTLPTKNNKYKSGTEKFIFDKQLNQFFGISGKSGPQSSVSDAEEAYNKALAESKKKLNLVKYLSETFYGGEVANFNAALKDLNMRKDSRLNDIKGAIAEAAKLKGITLNEDDLAAITEDNIIDKALTYGLDIKTVKKYLGIGSSTSSSVSLPEGYELVANGDLMADKNYYVAKNTQGRTEILQNINGQWNKLTLDPNQYLGDINTYLHRYRNGVIFTDNAGNIHIGNYGDPGFTNNDHQALHNLQTAIDEYANKFYQYYDKATGLNEVGKSSILDSILPNGGKIADITSQFDLGNNNYKVLLTGDSKFGNWASYSNTRGLIYDTEQKKSIPVTIHRNPDTNRVTITGDDGKEYYNNFLNNYQPSNFEWAGGEGGAALYNNPLTDPKIAAAIQQSDVMMDDTRQREMTGITRTGEFNHLFWGTSPSAFTEFRHDRNAFTNDIKTNWAHKHPKSTSGKVTGIGIVESINTLAAKNDWDDKDYQNYAKFVCNLFTPTEWPNKLKELGLNEHQITKFLTNLANLIKGGPQQPVSQKQGGSVTKIPKAQLGLGFQPGQDTNDLSKLKALKQVAQQDYAIKDAYEHAKETAPTRIGGSGNRTWNGHDYASLASSALTVGSLTGGPLGLLCQGTATVIDLFNDISNDNVSSADMWKNLGWNLAFTALSAVPFLGNLKLAKSAGKGFGLVKKATSQISKAKKELDKAGKLDDTMKAALDIVKKGSKEAGAILKEPGLIEAGLQSIGKFGLGAAKVAGHVATGAGVVSGVSSATNIIGDIADGKGVSLNDIEGVAFGIAATRNLGKLAERFAIKRVTKSGKEPVIQASKQSFKIGNNTVEIDIPTGSKRADIKTQLKTKLDELQNSLKTRQSQLLNGQQASALTGTAKTEYDAIQSQLDDLAKVDINKEMRKLGNLWKSTKTKLGDLKQSTKSRWDESVNGFDDGRIIMANPELEAKGLGILERWGVARAKKYGFYQEGQDLGEYLLQLKPNQAYLNGLGIHLNGSAPKTKPRGNKRGRRGGKNEEIITPEVVEVVGTHNFPSGNFYRQSNHLLLPPVKPLGLPSRPSRLALSSRPSFSALPSGPKPMGLLPGPRFPLPPIKHLIPRSNFPALPPIKNSLPPQYSPSIITRPDGQLAWAFKKGGQLSTLRKIVKASGGTVLKNDDGKDLTFDTEDEANAKIQQLSKEDSTHDYQIESVVNSGEVSHYIIKKIPKVAATTATTSTNTSTNTSVDAGDGTGTKKESGIDGTVKEPEEDNKTDELLANIFLNNTDVEDNNDQKIRTYDPYYFSAAAKYLGDLATNAQVYNDMKPTGPVYKTPVYKYNQTNDGAFTYNRGQEQEAAEQLFNAIQEGATSDSSVNLGTQLNAAKHLLKIKDQLAADRENRLMQDHAIQDQNEYNNRVESRDTDYINRGLSDNYLSQLGGLRAQKAVSDGASRNNFIQGLYTRAEETIDADNEQRMSEQWYKEYEMLQAQITQLEDAKNAKIKQIRTSVEESSDEELRDAASALIQEEENKYIKAKAKLEADFEKRWSTMPTPLHGQYQWLSKSPQSATPDASTTLVVTNKGGGSLTLAERKELEFVKATYKKLQKMQDRLTKQIKETNKQANLTMGALQKERLQLLRQQHEIRRK